MSRLTYTVCVKFTSHVYKDHGCDCIYSSSFTRSVFRQSGGQFWKANRNILYVPPEKGARGSVVVKALRSRDRFPVLSLDFSVTYFLPTKPWPWGRLSP